MLCKHTQRSDLNDFISLFCDLVFVQIVRPRPDENLYIHLLAYNHVMIKHWLSIGTKFSSRTTLLLSICSNGLAMLDVRFLGLGSRTSRRNCGQMLAAFHPEDIDIIMRPPRELHTDRSPSIIRLFALQVHAMSGNPHVVGSSRSEGADSMHFVYLLTIGGKGYMGRACGTRTRTSNTIHGLMPGWTVHVRELTSTLNKTVPPYRKRNRYVCLANPRCGAGCGIIAVSTLDGLDVAKAEAIAIALTCFPANGAQFKHLAELARHANHGSHIPRTNGRRRLRATASSKRRVYHSMFKSNLDNGGGPIFAKG